MNQGPKIEAQVTGEVIPEATFNNFLNGAANHEAKLLTTSIILSHPNIAFTRQKIQTEVIDRQGDNPVWRPAPTVAFGYCTESLAPISMVVLEQVKDPKGRIVDAYKANPEGLHANLALAGFLMSWSLDHPEVSLQQLLGATRSNSDARSPQTRYAIYQELLTGDEQATSLAVGMSLNSMLDSRVKGVDRQLRMLGDLGILDYVTKVRGDYNPKIQVINPEYYHAALKLEDRIPETQAIYKAMQKLSAKPDVSLEEMVVAVLDENPQVDRLKVRHLILSGANSNTHGLPGLKMVDPAFRSEQRSSIAINPRYESAVLDLCNGLESIKDGIDVEQWSRRATELVNNPEFFSQLMLKATENSAAFRAKHESLGSQILGVLRAHGKMTTYQLREGIQDQYGRTVSYDGIRTVLNTMVGEGAVAIKKERLSSNIMRQTSLYSVVDQTQVYLLKKSS